MSDPEPFWPLIYLRPLTVQMLYPYVVQAINNDMEGGEVLAELYNLRSKMRAWLQHEEVYVE